MPHHHLEGLKNTWQLVRETRESQIFRGTTPNGLEFTADIHFTPGSIATVTLVFVGLSGQFTDGISHQIFADMEHIVLRRGAYDIIDYSLSFAERITNGNYSISDEGRRAYGKSRNA